MLSHGREDNAERVTGETTVWLKIDYTRRERGKGKKTTAVKVGTKKVVRSGISVHYLKVMGLSKSISAPWVLPSGKSMKRAVLMLTSPWRVPASHKSL